MSRISLDARLREELVRSLAEGGAHIPFTAAVAGLPAELRGRRVSNLAHTAWQLVYHLRLAQFDIVEYIRKPAHVSPDYPSGYWPKQDGPADPGEWERTVEAFQADLEGLCALVRDPEEDLFLPRPKGGDSSLARAALLVIDHNAYHVGQLVDLRMLLGAPVRDW